jgi:hypothetical protein
MDAILSLSPAFTADTLKAHLLFKNSELFFNFGRDFYLIIILIIDINNVVTLQAMEMMVAAYICIKTLWVTMSFNDMNNPNFFQRYYGPVNGIKRNIRQFLPHFFKYLLGRGMVC